MNAADASVRVTYHGFSAVMMRWFRDARSLNCQPGQTTLMHATLDDNVAVAEYLVEQGADMNATKAVK